jgi:hypothetical protein
MATKRKNIRRLFFKAGRKKIKQKLRLLKKKQIREPFRPPNGLKVTDLRLKVLDMQMQLAVAIRENNKNRISY